MVRLESEQRLVAFILGMAALHEHEIVAPAMFAFFGEALAQLGANVPKSIHPLVERLQDPKSSQVLNLVRGIKASGIKISRHPRIFFLFGAPDFII